MGHLDGKVALITGAGGGLGEAYAKLFAREGAAVVVNDLGGPRDGSGSDLSMAEKVVGAIKAEGGRAVFLVGLSRRDRDARSVEGRQCDFIRGAGESARGGRDPERQDGAGVNNPVPRTQRSA